MAAQILSFASARLREPLVRDWSRQELAEFYRVESALLQAGLALESERGLSDEGDPWFVFCRADTGEVFIHFARVDGAYVVDGAAFGAPARGRDFSALVRDLIASHPLAATRRPGSNVMLHPAALLIALVGAAFFHSGKAKAAEPDGHGHAPDAAAQERRGLVFNVGGTAPAAGAGDGRVVALDAAEVAAVLTGVAIGLREVAADAASASVPASLPDLSDAARAPLRDLPTRADRTLASADALAGLSAPDARAALTVMAVFHDLARSVVATAAAAPVSTPVTVDTGLRAELSASPAAVGSSAEAAAPVLVVHLAAGPLPQIEALALVAADGVLAKIAPDRVVHVDQLPALISDLIAHGDGGGGGGGVGPTGSGSPPSGPSDDGTDPSAVPANVDHTGVTPDPIAHHDATTPTTSSATHPAASDTQAVVPHTAAPDISTPSQTGGSSPLLAAAPTVPAPAHDPNIDLAVENFVSQVANVTVLISGHDVVFYDPAILGALPVGETLDSVTWRLEDGSSVSLVGTASELHADHGFG